MGKVTSIGAIALVLIMLSACGSASEALPAVAPAKEKAKLVANTYRDGKIEIDYPQLEGMPDKGKQQAINETLRGRALEGARYYEGAEGEVTLDVDYAAELRPAGLLSVIYTGMGNVEGAAHPTNHFYASNIDLNAGKALALHDLVTIDGAFVQKLRQAKPKDSDPDSAEQAARRYLDEQNDESGWLAMFGDADLGHEGEPFSYVTKDALGVSFNVPHVMGDHVELELPIGELEGMLTPLGQKLLK
ncbi:hypothetical protein [Cohnella sp. GCM10027633]|uniref:hypothetical protein n=1 Tax=unclassified Cohnella TaxID=2636738 RepID=UPI00363DED74